MCKIRLVQTPLYPNPYITTSLEESGDINSFTLYSLFGGGGPGVVRYLQRLRSSRIFMYCTISICLETIAFTEINLN